MQLNKLKSGIKNSTQATLNLLSNAVGESNEETNFPYKLLLTNTQVSKFCKAFANIVSANIKSSKTQLFMIVLLSGLLSLLFLTSFGLFDSFKREMINIVLQKDMQNKDINYILTNAGDVIFLVEKLKTNI